MQLKFTWTWPRGTSLQYSFKVSIATLLGR
jgi:hypothetical protein